MMLEFAVLLVTSISLYLLGLWGWRNADVLAARTALPRSERERRTRVLQRGGITCQVAAFAFALLAVVARF